MENQVLDCILRAQAWTAIPGVKISRHTADLGDTGANEVVDGSYACQTATFNATSGGVANMASPVSFTNMPACSVSHVGIWSTDATPRFLFGGALSGGTQSLNAGPQQPVRFGGLTRGSTRRSVGVGTSDRG